MGVIVEKITTATCDVCHEKCGEHDGNEAVQCPCCLKSYADWNETEFIGWHGICVECEMNGVNDEH